MLTYSFEDTGGCSLYEITIVTTGTAVSVAASHQEKVLDRAVFDGLHHFAGGGEDRAMAKAGHGGITAIHAVKSFGFRIAPQSFGLLYY